MNQNEDKAQAFSQMTEAIALMMDVYQGVDTTERVNGMNVPQLLGLLSGMAYLNGQLLSGISLGEGLTEVEILQQLAQQLLEAEDA